VEIKNAYFHRYYLPRLSSHPVFIGGIFEFRSSVRAVDRKTSVFALEPIRLMPQLADDSVSAGGLVIHTRLLQIEA
jgi:hypothetical protein